MLFRTTAGGNDVFVRYDDDSRTCHNHDYQTRGGGGRPPDQGGARWVRGREHQVPRGNRIRHLPPGGHPSARCRNGPFGQYGLWFGGNDGVNFQLIAFDEGATIAEPEWSWLNEPLFVANHGDDHWHIHRVELVDGHFQGRSSWIQRCLSTGSPHRRTTP